VTPEDIAIYAGYLSDPAHLNANLAWFRALPQDMADTAEYRKIKLDMPVLAIGADGSLGDFVPTQVRQYASDVTAKLIAGSGHWIYEEQPEEMMQVLLEFLDSPG
jgi:pimeloyl-ACP methyl ester carboxylesterase